MKALMHRDPSRRLALGTLDCLLTCPTIWQDATLLETSGYTSAAAGRGGGSRSGGDGDNLALIAEDPHVPPGPSPPSVPASFPSSLPPPIVEICEIPPPFKRVLDRIGEDEGREMMLDETARRPDWMRLCEEWWVDFPSLEVLRQQRQQLQ